MSSQKVREDGIIKMVAAESHAGKEGFFVEVASGEASLVDGATDIPIGVIVDGGASGESSAIAVGGGINGSVLVKLDASPGTVNIGTLLQITATGTVAADAGTGGRTIVARALESGTANELIEAILIFPDARS